MEAAASRRGYSNVSSWLPTKAAVVTIASHPDHVHTLTLLRCGAGNGAEWGDMTRPTWKKKEKKKREFSSNVSKLTFHTERDRQEVH